MTAVKHTIRTYPGGAAAATKPYSIKLHADDSVLQSGNTDANGQVSYAPNLSPGPWYLTATDATPEPDAVRVISTKSSGSGGAYSLGELPMALRGLGNGVVAGYLNALAVSYDGAGLDLSVATGAAVVKGIPAVVNTAANPAIVTTRDAANPKACYLVLEVTGVGQTNEGKVEFKDVCGTAAASPALPALTQTEATYQYPLASFRLPTTASTTLTTLADVRTYLGIRNPVVGSVVRRVNPATEDTTTSTTGVDATGLTTTVTLLSGGVYDVTATALLVAKVTVGQTVSIAPYISGVGNSATYVDSNATTHAAIGNVHTLEGVVGTGAAISCGLRIKVSGGTGTYQVGYLEIVATPRS